MRSGLMSEFQAPEDLPAVHRFADLGPTLRQGIDRDEAVTAFNLNGELAPLRVIARLNGGE